jgi:hypothetical protein
MSIVFLLSVIFISLGLGAYLQSSNGRLFEGMKPDMDTEEGQEEGPDEINSEDTVLNEKPPLSEATIANGLKNSPLNNDGVESKEDNGVESKPDNEVEGEDIEKVEPFSEFTKSDYYKY